jgi:carbon-monoxide dehydrogenase iron sulfur subunit
MASQRKIRVDANLCRECQACALGCSLYHENGECSLGLARLVVTKDMARYEFQIAICQHCDSPDCFAACPMPGEAMVRDEQGVVRIVDDACLRCGACLTACPYNALFYHEASDRYLKCDLCVGREEGPLCVQLCPVGALTLSDEAICVEG